MRFQKLLLLFVLIFSVCPMSAFAGVEVSGQAAGDFNASNYGFATSPSLLLGAQLTVGMTDLFQFGGAYEHNSLSYSNGGGSGSMTFYGVVARIGTYSPVFFDGQGGLDERDGSGTSFSWGIGAGYKIPIAYMIDFSPRIGYRSVPDNGSERGLFDAGVLITVNIL
jgi:hypothetical protein